MLSFLISVFMSTQPTNLIDSPWRVVDDQVMGGQSAGAVGTTAEVLRFHGNLSRENNGGFSSIQAPLAVDMAPYTGVELSVRGDLRTYQLRFKHSSQPNAVSWVVDFPTSGNWQAVALEFESFRPTFRGQSVPQAGPLNPASISQIGILLKDGAEGDFWLEVADIHPVSTAKP